MATARATTAPNLFRLTLATYRQMGELGLIQPSDRVELLDGLLVTRMTKGPTHVLAVLAGARAMQPRLPAGVDLRPESPIELRGGPDGDSAPEPDLSLVRGTMTDYRDRHPGPADVLLVVEVADTALAIDRRGLRRYAWAGIPAAWIVNLRAGTVEVSTQPTGPSPNPGYASRVARTIGESLDLDVDGQPVVGLAVADFFP